MVSLASSGAIFLVRKNPRSKHVWDCGVIRSAHLPTKYIWQLGEIPTTFPGVTLLPRTKCWYFDCDKSSPGSPSQLASYLLIYVAAQQFIRQYYRVKLHSCWWSPDFRFSPSTYNITANLWRIALWSHSWVNVRKNEFIGMELNSKALDPNTPT